MVSDPGFQLPPHLNLIDKEIVEAIAAAEQGRSKHPQILLVEVPPRHGKSTLISVYTPAWYLGLFPERRVMLTSYEADFAASWGARAREVLAEHGTELFGVSLSHTARSARRWEIERSGGRMISAGVGGPLTGQGAHLLIIDDPVKNAEAAMSEVIREGQWEWWLSTARSRLEPGAVVIVLMTRWHEADLGGRLLAEGEAGSDPVTEIRLPALAGPADPLGRAEGEALWPERYSRAYLEHTRSSIGAYWWSAMYQGRPTPDEGGLFSRKDFRYFTIEGDLVELHRPDGSRETFGIEWCRKLQVVDLAASVKKTADYTVMTEVWVTPESDMLIRDVIRARIPGPEQPDFFEAHHSGGPVKFESIGYQSTIIQQMLARGFPAEPVFPDKDKVTRASAAGALYKGGKVYHLRGAEWLSDFEAELLAFPAGEHDDQVDALAYAARDLPNLRPQARRRPQRRDRGRPLTAGLLTMEL